MIIETRPREIGCILWGHCQNLLDDPRNVHRPGNIADIVVPAIIRYQSPMVSLSHETQRVRI